LQDKKRQRYIELAERIVAEKDPAILLKLIQELDQLLEHIGKTRSHSSGDGADDDDGAGQLRRELASSGSGQNPGRMRDKKRAALLKQPRIQAAGQTGVERQPRHASE
jgi:hypothetical protein